MGLGVSMSKGTIIVDKQLKIPREILQKEYYENNLTQEEIAMKFKTTQGYVSEMLGNYGLRDSEGSFLSYRSLNLNQELRNFIDGLLLGDGELDQQGKSTRLRIGQSQQHKSWLDEIKEWLEEEGVQSKITKIDNSESSRQDSFLLQSLGYREFNSLFERWYYSNRKTITKQKIIPKDLNLTSQCLANWFMGDGSLSSPTERNGWRIILYTDSFENKEVDWLRRKLNEILPHPPRIKSRLGNYLISINYQDSVFYFLNLVKPFIADCFHYKIRALEEV